MDDNRLVKQAFNESYYLYMQGKKSWVHYIIRNMTCIGFPFSGLSSYHAPTILHNIADNYISSLGNSPMTGSIKRQTLDSCAVLQTDLSGFGATEILS